MFQAEREEKNDLITTQFAMFRDIVFFSKRQYILAVVLICDWLYIQAEWLNFSLNIMRIIAIFIGCMHTLKAIIK